MLISSLPTPSHQMSPASFYLCHIYPVGQIYIKSLSYFKQQMFADLKRFRLHKQILIQNFFIKIIAELYLQRREREGRAEHVQSRLGWSSLNLHIVDLTFQNTIIHLPSLHHPVAAQLLSQCVFWPLVHIYHDWSGIAQPECFKTKDTVQYLIKMQHAFNI